MRETLKKSCKNDEESGRKKCKRLDAKYKKKKSSDYRHHSKLQRNVTEKSDKK